MVDIIINKIKNKKLLLWVSQSVEYISKMNEKKTNNSSRKEEEEENKKKRNL